MEVKIRKLIKGGKNMLKEFKKFIARGNVIDLAVGVIVGSAFGNIVTSIVDDVLMPLIGIIIGGLDFSNLKITIGEAEIKYGNFIQNVVDFLIVAFCIFILVKIVNKITHKKEEQTTEKPVKSAEVILLEEIRDLIKEKEIQ